MATQLMETVHVEKAAQAELEAAPGLMEIRFYTMNPLTAEDAQLVFDDLWSRNVDVKKVYIQSEKGLPYLGVVYRKPAGTGISALPLAIIPLIAFGLIATLVGIGIFNIESITGSIGKLLLIVLGGTIVIVALARKPLEAAATRYIEKR